MWGLEGRKGRKDCRERLELIPALLCVVALLITSMLSILPSLAAVNLNILYKQDCYELIQTLHQS